MDVVSLTASVASTYYLVCLPDAEPIVCLYRMVDSRAPASGPRYDVILDVLAGIGVYTQSED